MASFTMPVQTPEEVRRGIFYMIASVFVFALVNALVKWQAAIYPVAEVVFFRSGFALIPCTYLIASHGGFPELRTRRIKDHFGRAVLSFASMVLIFTAFKLMPLADAIALSFSSPLFLTVLSIPLLGEQVGRHRWSAVAVGFLGILLMVRPGSGVFQIGSLMVLGNAAISASIGIAIRRMTLTETTVSLVCYQVIFTAALSLLLLPFGWSMPGWRDAAVLSAMGLCAGIGQFWWTQACRLAPASVTAPFSYMAMIWAIVFGYFLWSDVPDATLLLGAAVVIASGLYILYRETMRSARKPAALATRGGG